MNEKQLRWYNIALMAFVSVWGLGNVVNNYALQGLTVVTSWILIMIFYFVPYTLSVGQLGSTFKEASGGVSSWIHATSTKRLAYYAAWTYWVVHIPYLAQKPQGILLALSWLIQGNGDFVNTVDSKIVSAICLVIFLLFLWISSKGLTTLKMIGNMAGTAMFIMSILFIILAVSAPALRGTISETANMTHISTYIPKINVSYLTTISMLVFAVGGCEKISPYVNSTKNASREFPKGMIILAIMVAVCALLGSIAMGMLFDANNIPDDLMVNGSYQAFAKLGNYYGVGRFFVILYSVANSMAQVSALAFSIDAPLKILLSDADDDFIPKKLSKVNKQGTPVNGYLFTGILVSILIIIPSLGIGNMTELIKWMTSLNAIVMPMRYLWVFLAYMWINKQHKKFTSDYKFVKNPIVGYIIGLWCFVFTAFACILGMLPKIAYSADHGQYIFQLAMNILTPIVLIALGMIMPALARKEKKQII